MNPRSLLAIVAILVSSNGSPLHAASPATAFAQEARARVEEIYVFRTARTGRTRGATPFCANAGFESTAEDYYELWSIDLNTRSSRVSATHVRPVGGFRACFTTLAAGRPLSMYAKGTTAGITWTGMGECTLMAAQPPVRTVLALNCNLAVSDISDGYVGGLLTSSTLAPALGANQPPDAHVPGYLSTSVVTLRLWRRPE